jgi:hypothetical protein
MSDFEFDATKQVKAGGPGDADLQEAAKTAAESETKPETPEKPKYDKDELARIFDEMMFQGEYSETTTLRGKFKVTFRTRSAQETMSISKELDAATFNFMVTAQEQRSVLHLAYSLTNYGGKDLSSMAPTPDRMNFILKLPAPVIAALDVKRNEFDAKVSAAVEEADENF